MFYTQKTAIRKKIFDLRMRNIYNSPPTICSEDSNLIILSQLHEPDVTMYMIAVKSFANYVSPKKFIIVDDGLKGKSITKIKNQLENVEFIPAETVRPSPCPSKGTWERILSIADNNKDHYVIQLDADTITLSSPTEVLECIKRSTSFTLGTPGGERVATLSETSEIALNWKGNHVQAISEQLMVNLPEELGRRYVHGCSGFAGFAPKTLTREKLNVFSCAMEALVGEKKWKEWGSEQITSNFMVANCENAIILPPSTYPFWERGVNISNAKFIHFFGTHRFVDGQYIRSAKEIIKKLRIL